MDHPFEDSIEYRVPSTEVKVESKKRESGAINGFDAFSGFLLLLSTRNMTYAVELKV
jgi:hypothetical protein